MSGIACVPHPSKDGTTLQHKTASCEDQTPTIESANAQHSVCPYLRGHTTCAVEAVNKDFKMCYLAISKTHRFTRS